VFLVGLISQNLWGWGDAIFCCFTDVLEGVLKKCVFFDGNLLVKSWWNAWFLWWENASYFTAKDLPFF
jgi:hypothetical protein